MQFSKGMKIFVKVIYLLQCRGCTIFGNFILHACTPIIGWSEFLCARKIVLVIYVPTDIYFFRGKKNCWQVMQVYIGNNIQIEICCFRYDRYISSKRTQGIQVVNTVALFTSNLKRVEGYRPESLDFVGTSTKSLIQTFIRRLTVRRQRSNIISLKPTRKWGKAM